MFDFWFTNFFYTFIIIEDLCALVAVCTSCIAKFQSVLYVCGCVWLDLVVVPGKPEQLYLSSVMLLFSPHTHISLK